MFMFKSVVRPGRIALWIVITLLVSGTLNSAHPSRAAQTSTPTFTNDNVRKLVVLGKMRGHLLASITDWDNAQYDLAMHHADELPNELNSILAADLKSAGLQDQFLAAANAFDALSGKAGDKTATHAAYDALIGVIDKAATAFAPVAAFSDPAFRLSVAQGLLNGISEEYGEGVVGGKLISTVGYQNAVGFLQIAKENYTAAQKAIQEAHADLDQAVSAQYAALDKWMPANFNPPAPLGDPNDVQTAIDAIKTAESTTLSLDLEDHRSVPEVIAASRAKLSDALAAYSSGQADTAYEAATSGYLDNYEGLEVALRKKDSALTDTLEQQFLSFAKMIKDGQSLDNLKALFTQIDANLSKAQTDLTA